MHALFNSHADFSQSPGFAQGWLHGTEYMAYGVTDLFGFEAVFSPAVLLDSTNGLIQLQS